MATGTLPYVDSGLLLLEGGGKLVTALADITVRADVMR
jgi:hypothetical protein